MDKWLRISLQLCLYGFFNGIQPSTQFNFRILNEFRGLPKSEVSSFFYVQLIYWRFGLGLLAFLFTDISRYKPSIIISSLSALIGFTTMRCTTERNFLYVCGWLILFWHRIVRILNTKWVTAFYLQVTAFSFALSLATDLAYFTYIYAKVDRDHYQQVTSNSRCAVLVGRCLGALTGQLFVIYSVIKVEDLIYLSIASE